ncbi:MAG: hypothetical protein BWY19_00390 [bacterium ADurb.Bin212]|nr:MAG: hypothetical protein BWY19_00390 [bacterium ADurb.Bin212]
MKNDNGLADGFGVATFSTPPISNDAGQSVGRSMIVYVAFRMEDGSDATATIVGWWSLVGLAPSGLDLRGLRIAGYPCKVYDSKNSNAEVVGFLDFQSVYFCSERRTEPADPD